MRLCRQRRRVRCGALSTLTFQVSLLSPRRDAQAAKHSNLSRAPRMRRRNWSCVDQEQSSSQTAALRSSLHRVRAAASVVRRLQPLASPVLGTDASGDEAEQPDLVIARDPSAPDGVGMQLQLRLPHTKNGGQGGTLLPVSPIISAVEAVSPSAWVFVCESKRR